MTSINIFLSIPFVFILSFSLIAFFGARYSPLQQAVEKLYYATLNVSTAKNGLIGSVNEIPKFSILRILFGLILLYNSSNVLLLATDLDLQITQFKILSIVGLIGSICILFGVLTQFTLVLFCTFQWQYGETFLTTQSLVNDVASILAVFLFLTNAGSRISVDGILLRSNSVWLRRLLGYFNISNNEIVISKFISLTSYWLLCLYSLAKHLDERPWVEGYAGPQILTNSYVNPKWEIFDQLFTYHPIFLQFASASLWVMMLWYAVMVPFVLFGGKLRLLVVVWGVLFFALSTFVLDLRGLGEIEFLIWAAIFLYTPKKVDVYYDDKCNLCDRTVQFLKFLDITSTINLRPVSKNQDAANKLGFSTKEILSDLHGITLHNNHAHVGYDLYVELSKTLILLYPLYPILRLGKALRLGPAIYRFIADRRTKYFGICTMPSHYKNWRTKEGFPFHNFKILPYVLVHFFAFGLVFLISIPLPFLGWQGVSDKSIPVLVSNVYGLTPINVFNGIDLQSGENWFILEQEDGERAPIYFPDGRRDAYHRSDRFYFVVSNTYRRLAALENIQKGKLFCHIQDEVMQTYIIKMIRQHLNVSNYEGALIYRQFYKAVPQPSEISENKYIQRVPYEVCVVKINNG